MPVKDETRWKQNEDGSWSRRVETDRDLYAIAAEIDATPGAKDAATELGVDLATINGTGKDGKITKADVEAAAKEE